MYMSSSAVAIAALPQPVLVAAAVHPAQEGNNITLFNLTKLNNLFFLFPNTLSGDGSSHSVMMHSDKWIVCQARSLPSSSTIAL